ncbi:uncharacterized protein LOC62_07G008835 [Vanrija pseudolonga]|uniref:F-box domain-containing protein n=1 Tax=Vanrija pseudolonga TaxID=143232 RepID=A0AAF1BPC9_9TREE|nr:hypothetical protein LOC62_07G008835 [Vanrija pseudolonga]
MNRKLQDENDVATGPSTTPSYAHGPLRWNPKHTRTRATCSPIQGAFVPHIVDRVFQFATAHDPSTLRLVCRRAKHVVDSVLCYHISLAMHTAHLGGRSLSDEPNFANPATELLLGESPIVSPLAAGYPYPVHSARTMVDYIVDPTKVIGTSSPWPKRPRRHHRIPGLKWGRGVTPAEQAECIRLIRLHTKIVAIDDLNADPCRPYMRDRRLYTALSGVDVARGYIGHNLFFPRTAMVFDDSGLNGRVLPNPSQHSCRVIAPCVETLVVNVHLRLWANRPRREGRILFPPMSYSLRKVVVHVQFRHRVEGRKRRATDEEAQEGMWDGLVESIASRLDLEWTVVGLSKNELAATTIGKYGPNRGMSSPDRLRQAIRDAAPRAMRGIPDRVVSFSGDDLDDAINRVRIVSTKDYRREVGERQYELERVAFPWGI